MITINNNIKKADVTELIQFCASALNIKNVTLNLFENDRLLKKFDTDTFQLDALLYKTPILHVYNLSIRKSSLTSLEKIICHEMIHLLQYESGKLNLDIDKGVFTWLGDEYTGEITYFKRPWEIEAFNGQSLLLKQYKKEQKQKKKVGKINKK